MNTIQPIYEPRFPHLESLIREAKEEQTFINGTVIPYMREHGYSAQSGAMNWSSIKLVASNPDIFPALEHRVLKFEEFFTFKGYAVCFDEAKFMEYYDQTKLGRERLETLRCHNSQAQSRRVIHEEVY